MKMDEFLEKFIDAVEIENAASITAATALRDIEEWDSVAILSVIALADEEYGVELNPEVFRTVVTVTDLYEAIVKNDD